MIVFVSPLVLKLKKLPVSYHSGVIRYLEDYVTAAAEIIYHAKNVPIILESHLII